jgi:Arc/MetJ-type ribon-helix-helix transcriptional regulator
MPRKPEPINPDEPGFRKESISFPREMAIAMREHVRRSKRKYSSVSHYLQCLVHEDLEREGSGTGGNPPPQSAVPEPLPPPNSGPAPNSGRESREDSSGTAIPRIGGRGERAGKRKRKSHGQTGR